MKHLQQMIGEIIHHCPRLHHASVFISVSQGLMRRVFRRGAAVCLSPCGKVRPVALSLLKPGTCQRRRRASSQLDGPPLCIQSNLDVHFEC